MSEGEGEPEQNDQRAPTSILDEVHIPEGRGLLGGRRLVTTPTGGIVREVRIGFCDICGIRLGENYIVCPICRRKIDLACSIRIESQVLCTMCVRDSLPLSKRAYQILVCIANSVCDTRVLRNLTRIGKDDVKGSLFELMALGLIEKRGLSIFSTFHVTDKGLTALGVLCHIFGKDADISYLDIALRRHLSLCVSRSK